MLKLQFRCYLFNNKILPSSLCKSVCCQHTAENIYAFLNNPFFTTILTTNIFSPSLNLTFALSQFLSSSIVSITTPFPKYECTTFTPFFIQDKSAVLSSFWFTGIERLILIFVPKYFPQYYLFFEPYLSVHKKRQKEITKRRKFNILCFVIIYFFRERFKYLKINFLIWNKYPNRFHVFIA
jgi:hypothetical protein